MNTTHDGGNQQPSEVRGDPGAPSTSSDGTRDKDSSSSPAIAQALITALNDLLFEDSDKSDEARLVTRIKARAALTFAEKG